MDLRHALLEKDVLVLDGGLGTALEARGEHLHPTLWSAGHLISHPEAIADVHRAYLSAGADIITTASYQISYQGLSAQCGYSRTETDQLIALATKLAHNAAIDFPGRLVASSVGCYGDHLANGSEFCGNYGLTATQLAEWHTTKFSVHASTGLVACETVPCLAEVKALVSVLGSQPKNVQGWLSLSCQSGQLLVSGDSVEDACRALEDPSAGMSTEPRGDHDSAVGGFGLGVNCSAPEHVEEILLTMRDHCRRGRVLVAYPNRGEPWNDAQRCYEAGQGHSDEAFAVQARRWREAGARVVGGCCRTDHGTITALHAALR